MSTRSSPTSSRRERSAPCPAPAGAAAPARAASCAAGTPKSTPADPEVGERAHLLAEALLGVLEHARHRRHRFGRVDSFLHEERRDQIVDVDARLADEAAQRRSATQPPRPMLGKRHAARVPPEARRSAPDGAYAPA